MVIERSNWDYIPEYNVRRTDDYSARGKYQNDPIIHESTLFESEWGYTRERNQEEIEYLDVPIVPAVSIVLDISGEKIKLPIKLRKIAEAIKEAKEILDYEDNWDDNGANATDGATFKKAINFLVSYSIHLLKFFVIDKPFIDILRDGSVTINWETEKASLLIVFKKGDKEMSYLFGQSKDKKKPPFPYYVNGNEIDEMLALWMSKNLL